MTQTPAVTFNYIAWVARYPGLAAVDSDFAQLLFNEASLYCANVLGIVCDVNTLSALLNMLTAHLAYLNAPQLNGQPNTAGTSAPPSQIGRVSNASEGSVTVAFDMPNQPQGAAWYQQTQPGASFWAATARFRTFRYVPGAPMQPAFPTLGSAPWPIGPRVFTVR